MHMSEAPDDAVRSLISPEPGPEEVPVVVYDFMFTCGRGLGIDVWPTLGDTVVWDETERTWTFTFPRLKRTRKVRYADVATYEVEEHTQIYISPEQRKQIMTALMKRKRDAKSKSKDS
jgi:hypothetical protein